MRPLTSCDRVLAMFRLRSPLSSVARHLSRLSPPLAASRHLSPPPRRHRRLLLSAAPRNTTGSRWPVYPRYRIDDDLPVGRLDGNPALTSCSAIFPSIFPATREEPGLFGSGDRRIGRPVDGFNGVEIFRIAILGSKQRRSSVKGRQSYKISWTFRCIPLL